MFHSMFPAALDFQTDITLFIKIHLIHGFWYKPTLLRGRIKTKSLQKQMSNAVVDEGTEMLIIHFSMK